MTTKQFLKENSTTKSIEEIKRGDNIVIRGGLIEEVTSIRDGKVYSYNPYGCSHPRPVRGTSFTVLNKPV